MVRLVFTLALAGCTVPLIERTPVVDLGTAPLTVRVLPEAPTTMDALYAEVLATDGRAMPAWTLSWAVDGLETSEWTDTTLPSAATRKNEVWTARVTLADGTWAEGERLVLNARPTVQLVPVDPSPAVGDDLEVSVSTWDADDDPVQLTWSWSVDGELDPAGYRERVPGDSTRDGQVWVATARPNDAQSWG